MKLILLNSKKSFELKGPFWSDPVPVDIHCPHDEAFSKVSGLPHRHSSGIIPAGSGAGTELYGIPRALAA